VSLDKSHEMPNPSACIPPPSEYTPKARVPSSKRYRERGGRGGRDHKRQRQERPTTFTRDSRESKQATQPKDRFYKNEDDDYFAHVQDEEEEAENKAEAKDCDDDEEDDPLDAYMKSLEGGGGGEDNQPDPETKVSEENGDSAAATAPGPELDKRGIRLDIDNTDDIEESYYKYVEQTRSKRPNELESEDSEDKQNAIEYDRDGNVLGVRKVKREIEPLPPIDHSLIAYRDFNKIFYQEHSEIQKLTQEQGEELRSKLDIKVSGESVPKPVCSFAHFKFEERLMKVIRRSDYTQPTPIQAQAIPAALLGRNIIGIAMTGSGKTAAYLWPMIVHIMGQPDLKQGDGPIALVLVPTRELALQVYGEAKKFSSSYKIAVVCAYGGGSKYEQSRDLESGAEIVVATPGRLIDLIKLGVTNLERVTYLVLDEADRFFEMGFEAQVRSICDHIRPDRQTLLFSATFKHKIEKLARTVTENPVKIVQRSLGEANEDVTQHVLVMPVQGSKKWEWLTSKLVEFTSVGSVLIFVTRIANSEELYANLRDNGKEALLLHGDMEQSERNRVITSFKRKEKDIMIATDVAARGLDISHIRTVINYDVARDIDTHIHRVGRTGRAGSKGDAYTLVTDKDREFAGHLVKNLESSNQEVTHELMKLAMQSHTFRKSRDPKRQNNHHHHNHHHHHRHDWSRNRESGHSRGHEDYTHRNHKSRNTSPHEGSSGSRHSSKSDHERSFQNNRGDRSGWHKR